jgi:hypothetical protein
MLSVSTSNGEIAYAFHDARLEDTENTSMHAVPNVTYPNIHRAYAVIMITYSHPPVYSNSKLSLTHFRTRFLNSGVFSRHRLAASTFAGDSSLGLESIDMTERRMVSGVWTGDQRSAADS